MVFSKHFNYLLYLARFYIQGKMSFLSHSYSFLIPRTNVKFLSFYNSTLIVLSNYVHCDAVNYIPFICEANILFSFFSKYIKQTRVFCFDLDRQRTHFCNTTLLTATKVNGFHIGNTKLSKKLKKWYWNDRANAEKWVNSLIYPRQLLLNQVKIKEIEKQKIRR